VIYSAKVQKYRIIAENRMKV